MNSSRVELRKNKKPSKKLIVSAIAAGIIAVATAALLILNIFIPVRYLSAYIVFGRSYAESGKMYLHFLDVGFGDCTFIEFPDGKNMLIDAGSGSRANQLSILRFLNRRGVDRLDYLVSTSVDNRRCGGLAEMVKFKKPYKIFMPDCAAAEVGAGYKTFIDAVSDSGAAVEYAAYGKSIVSDGYACLFLSPSRTNRTEENSAAIYLSAFGTGFMLMSDVTERISSEIVKKYMISGCFETDGVSFKLESRNIIKVPANGSAASACTEMYNILKPETAVISTGKNSEGCPSAAALSNAYNFAGERIYRTDRDGNVTIVADGNSYEVTTEK